jgi:putative membrane protein
MTEVLERNPRFDVSPTVNNHLAWVRSALALERTMTAWLRTAVSLIGFGFAIVQFFARIGHVPDARGTMFRTRRSIWVWL